MAHQQARQLDTHNPRRRRPGIERIAVSKLRPEHLFRPLGWPATHRERMPRGST